MWDMHYMGSVISQGLQGFITVVSCASNAVPIETRVLMTISISPGDSPQVINSTADYSQVKWSVEQGKDRFASKLTEPTAAVHEEL